MIRNLKNTSAAVINVTSRSLADIKSPANVIWVQESSTRSKCARMFPRNNNNANAFDSWHSYSATAGRETISNVHNGGGNLLFCDGHAKWKAYTSIRSSDFGLMPDQAWSKTNTNYPDGGGTWQESL